MKLTVCAYADAGDPENVRVYVLTDWDKKQDDLWIDRTKERVRMSKSVEIELPDIDDQQNIIDSHVLALDDKIEEIRAQANAACEELTRRKRELLQLTYVPAGE